jgi:hypothetical protein
MESKLVSVAQVGDQKLETYMKLEEILQESLGIPFEKKGQVRLFLDVHMKLDVQNPYLAKWEEEEAFQMMLLVPYDIVDKFS